MGQIKFDQECREALERGTSVVAKTVGSTLGPKGNNVAYSGDFGIPQVINDGVSVAKEIELDDPFENIGAQLIKEASIRTNELAGDGTSTSVVLAQAIIHEGMRNIAAGANAIILRNGIHYMTDKAVDLFKDYSTEVLDNKQIGEVATISAGNKEIGDMVAQAMDVATLDGVISVQESKGMTTTLETVTGTQIDTGWITPYCITDVKRMVAELNNPLILITDEMIMNIKALAPTLKIASEAGRTLVIIANDVTGNALQQLMVNKQEGRFISILVKAPGYAGRQLDILEDLASITGGKVVSNTLGKSLKDVTPDCLGTAELISSYSNRTVITGGAGTQDQVQERVDIIKAQIEEEDTPYLKEKLQTRLSRLSGGVAVIKVGAASEAEMIEKKLRIEDALSATKAATEEGILPGGGTTYVQSIPELEGWLTLLEGDERTGAEIVLKAFEAPLWQIATNAGVKGDVIVEQVKQSDHGVGYDALNNKMVNMKDAGIIDPTKVTRCALQHAASIASTLLTTNSIIIQTKE